MKNLLQSSFCLLFACCTFSMAQAQEEKTLKERTTTLSEDLAGEKVLLFDINECLHGGFMQIAYVSESNKSVVKFKAYRSDGQWKDLASLPAVDGDIQFLQLDYNKEGSSSESVFLTVKTATSFFIFKQDEKSEEWIDTKLSSKFMLEGKRVMNNMHCGLGGKDSKPDYFLAYESPEGSTTDITLLYADIDEEEPVFMHFFSGDKLLKNKELITFLPDYRPMFICMDKEKGKPVIQEISDWEEDGKWVNAEKGYNPKEISELLGVFRLGKYELFLAYISLDAQLVLKQYDNVTEKWLEIPNPPSDFIPKDADLSLIVKSSSLDKDFYMIAKAEEGGIIAAAYNEHDKEWSETQRFSEDKVLKIKAYYHPIEKFILYTKTNGKLVVKSFK